MGASDSTLEILIRTVYEATGSTLALGDAKKLQASLERLAVSSEEMNTHLPEGSALWGKYKNILQETTGEANKLGIGHRQLFFVMEQMGARIPGLGFLLRGMLTPATVAVVGLVGAWELWNKRVEEGVQALSGMTLPDLSAHAQQMSVATENARTYAEALRSVVEAYNSIDAASDRNIKKIQAETDAHKKLAEARRAAALANLEANRDSMSKEEYAKRKGQITGKSDSEIEDIDREQDRKEIEEKKRRHDELATSAATKRAQADKIKVASAETDAANLADAKAQADAATEAKTKSHDWINRIGAAKDSNFEALKTSPEFSLRYGMSTSGSEAVGIEQSNIANADVVIKRYQDMVKGTQSRDDARTLRQKLLQESGKEAGEAKVLSESIPDDERAMAARRVNQGSVDQLKAHPDLVSASDRDLATGATVQEFLSAQRRLQSHHGNNGDSQTVAAMNELLKTSQQSDQRMLLLIRELIAHKGDLSAALEGLSRDVATLDARASRPMR